MSTLVKDGWVQGFAIVKGRNADYRAGRNLKRANTRHITAGACGGDMSVLLRGYANAYAPKSPQCGGHGRCQLAQIDAVTYHNCEWNKPHTGLEVEKRTVHELMNGYQLDSCGLWVAACAEIDIPMTDLRLDGAARYAIGTLLRGHVDHQDLQHRACDMHSDGWPLPEWLQILVIARRYLGAPVEGPDLLEDSVEVLHNTDDDSHVLVTSLGDTVLTDPDDKWANVKAYGSRDLNSTEVLRAVASVRRVRDDFIKKLVAADPD